MGDEVGRNTIEEFGEVSNRLEAGQENCTGSRRPWTIEGRIMMDNFQRKGSKSNAHVGKIFEEDARRFFQSLEIPLSSNFALEIGIEETKKAHAFDLGSSKPPILVECKSHTWTEGGNVPSAKMIAWNEVMYYFAIAPKSYRKILFVLRDFSQKRDETLAEYYIRTHNHLIPKGVEIWEFDEVRKTANRVE